MVTVDEVWAALEEIDPEIPVISLVDLGVVKHVEIEGESVRIDFTPTFMGCPASTRCSAMVEKVEGLGAHAEVRVVLDDSWSTDQITAEGKEKLRAAGFAPPAPRTGGEARPRAAPARVPLPLLRVDGHDPREHLRPTPCRSIRYCNACRQPFEQFKTI